MSDKIPMRTIIKMPDNRPTKSLASSPSYKSPRDSKEWRGGTSTSLKKLVFVGMSGGVDSSVAAYLLKNQGYKVVGVYMKCYNLDGCSEGDAEDARRVAEQLHIPFYVWDFEEEYKKRVVEYMIDGYRRGETPNPDVMCNREIKFGLFLNRALKMGADYVATGHYVELKKIKNKTGGKNSPAFTFQLFSGRDENKDQSYFLWTLTQEQLAHSLFPIGGYTKPKVRDIAKRVGLATADKKDSQGICFLGQVSMSDFLKKYLSLEKGDVLTTDGQKIGEHQGAWFYTIGQRHGLDLRMKNKELRIKGKTKTGVHYVADKSVKRNTLIVAEGEDNPDLLRQQVELRDCNWIAPEILDKLRQGEIVEVHARIRYRQPLAAAKLKVGRKKKMIFLEFESPQKFVAEGQSAVVYAKSGQVLGGGVIAKSE